MTVAAIWQSFEIKLCVFLDLHPVALYEFIKVSEGTVYEIT
jgi:hypothetical protein